MKCLIACTMVQSLKVAPKPSDGQRVPLSRRVKFHRNRVLGRILLTLCLTGTTCAASPPNFIIILADDMGYGDSSVYNGWIQTPHMERMAREGMTFSDFHSSGTVCSPTRAGLLTGRYQQRAGIPAVVNADAELANHYCGLQPRETTFAELLNTAGYKTAIFGKWHLGYDKKYNPTFHGFDRFRGFVSGNIDYISHFDRMETYDWWEGTRHVQEPGYLTDLLTKHAVAFISEHREVPFCCYVPHGAVHAPIQAADSPAGRGPNKHRQPQLARTQGETVKLMTQSLDDSIGAILDAVNEAEIAERTFVLFFSDNGGAKHMRCDPLRGRKGTVWEGGHRVPAIAWWPETIKAGSKTDQLAISLDVMPTILDFAGVSVPGGHKLDGVSLKETLLEEKRIGPRQLFWNAQAMRDGPWKLVRSGRQNLLFNLDEDIGETTDMAAEHGERVSAMLKALKQWETDVETNATEQPDMKKAIAAGRARRKATRKTEGR